MKVALVYHPDYLRHDTGDHVENAGRLTAVLETLEETGVDGLCCEVCPGPATEETVLAVHTIEHLQRLNKFAAAGGGCVDPDTVVGRESYDVALLAAGGALTAVDAVIGGEDSSAFALLRPPGHHAGPTRAMGFCLINNVAVAAAYACSRYNLERVAVLDWDVHHGNGTQEIFYRDPRVLYLSVHQSPYYPGTGWAREIGEGDGEGFNINVPLPAGCGDQAYHFVFKRVFEPVLKAFKPQLVLISAGQDGHFADPLAGMRLTARGYGRLAAMVKAAVAPVPVAAVLEGGYDPTALGFSVASIIQALADEEITLEEPLEAPRDILLPAARIRVDEVIATHRQKWPL